MLVDSILWFMRNMDDIADHSSFGSIVDDDVEPPLRTAIFARSPLRKKFRISTSRSAY